MNHPLRVLFVSNSKHLLYPTRDASTRYRCLHPVETLNALGHHADLCTQREFASHLIGRYDVYVFHRPRYSRYFSFLVSRLNKLGKTLIADYDDLLFTPEHARDAPIYRNGQSSLRITRKLHENYLAALQLFDHFTVSTAPLAEQIRLKQQSAKVEVIHNGYSPNWVAQAKTTIPEAGKIIAGYFPGTKSHDRDFEQIAPNVAGWLVDKRHSLTIVGPLTITPNTFPSGTVQSQPHVPYRRLPQLISACHITLAPLEETLFNHCKSGIKFIESALFGVPIISSPIPDMKRFHNSELILADSPAEFLEGLYRLSDEYGTSETQRQKLREYALANCTSLTETKHFLGFIRALGTKTSPPIPSSLDASNPTGCVCE